MHEMEEIFSKKVRAGRRTYFFDVRETKAYNKESKRRKKMIGNYGKYGGNK